MRKYLKVISNSVQNSLVYRFNNFSFILSNFIILGVFFYLWASIYRQGGQVGGYALPQLVFYYLAVNFIVIVFRGSDVAKRIGEQIRQGRFNIFLVKPIGQFSYQLACEVGGIFYRGAIAVVSFGLLAWFFSSYFDLALSFKQVNFFIVLALLGFLIDFIIFYIIGLSTFWFGYIMGLNYVVNIIENFLEGSIIPLDLLPAPLIAINNWLPFKHVVFVPIAVFTGRLAPNWSMFLVPIGWIIFLYLISKVVFKFGVKKYEGFGA